jgi:hypothetical protein
MNSFFFEKKDAYAFFCKFHENIYLVESQIIFQIMHSCMKCERFMWSLVGKINLNKILYLNIWQTTYFLVFGKQLIFYK